MNLTAETNREDDVTYFWIFPDGSIDDRENPGAIKLDYGQHEVLLVAHDEITGDIQVLSMKIDHRPIPKKPKKPASSNFTLDLKDVPQDMGGGFAIVESTPLQKLGMSLTVLVLLSSGVYIVMKK